MADAKRRRLTIEVEVEYEPPMIPRVVKDQIEKCIDGFSNMRCLDVRAQDMAPDPFSFTSMSEYEEGEIR